MISNDTTTRTKKGSRGVVSAPSSVTNEDCLWFEPLEYGVAINW